MSLHNDSAKTTRSFPKRAAQAGCAMLLGLLLVGCGETSPAVRVGPGGVVLVPAPAAQSPTQTTTPAQGATPCRVNPLAAVYNPNRLVVRTACMTLTGTVAHIAHEADGDYHVQLKLDPAYAQLINSGNTKN